jgi:hypothetical protein
LGRINWKVALIAGVPLGLIVAAAEGGLRDPLSFAVTALLCLIILGVPQGYLAAWSVLIRRRWRLGVLLLPALVLAGLISTAVAMVVAMRLPDIVPTGRWEPVPPPPARPTKLLGCPDPFTTMAHVLAEDGRIYQFLGIETWRAVDVVQSSDRGCGAFGASPTPRTPGAEVSRVLVNLQSVHCLQENQFVLLADGSIWQWSRTHGYCAETSGLGLLPLYLVGSCVLSVVAWAVVATGKRRPTSTMSSPLSISSTNEP